MLTKKILKRKIKFIIEPIMNFIRKHNHKRSILFTRYYEKYKVQEDVILYESRDGKSLTDSPYAIFSHLLDHQDFDSYKHVWSIDNFANLDKIIKKYKKYNNVIFVKRNSKEYLKYLTTSKYLINNSTFQSFFIPKKEQIYINTWHGTPLKTMGFDIPGNPAHSQNVVRNFLSTNYILSPNKHTTNIFLKSYKLDGIYSGSIIEDGYPRIDLTLNLDTSKFRQEISEYGLKIDANKSTILYAPTWKGKSVNKVSNDIYQIMADIETLNTHLGNEFNVLVKVHPFLYDEAVKHLELKECLIPDYVDTNQLLGLVDLLITDYSSIFFDYLVTDKPIVFYTLDEDEYNEERQKYFKDEELPGPVCLNIKDLIYAIKNKTHKQSQYQINYKSMKEKFVNYDDGNVTKRLVDYLFLNETTNIKVINNLDNKKEKIVLYPGGMANNGITSSVINLLDNIDYTKYDVSCFMKTPKSPEVLNNLNKVNENVRFLFKLGVPSYKLNEVYRDKLIKNRGVFRKAEKKLYPESAYKREVRRLFGNSEFDYGIDFSGYSFFWAKYIISIDAKKKLCYMHNDLLSDSERTVNGKRPHRQNLRGLFSIYNKFDKLVSVSKGTMELNKKNLLQFANEEKFDYILNSINPDKILHLSGENKSEETTSEQSEPIIDYSNYKARSIVKPEQNSKVLRRPICEIDNIICDAIEYEGEEVTIQRKAIVGDKVFYKFKHKNLIIGWMEECNFAILPDSILERKELNKLAIVKWPRNNDIWNKPFKLKRVKKVSNSYDYKDIMVYINEEVKTQHSSYSRIYINQTKIGWIDNSALKTVKEYNTKDSLFSKVDKKLRKSLNHYKHRFFIKNIDNRILREYESNKIAVISNPENYKLWSKPSPHPKAKEIMAAEELLNTNVLIKKTSKTVNGKYHYVIKDEIKGWLNNKAVKYVEEPIELKNEVVKKIGITNVSTIDSFYSDPLSMYEKRKGNISISEGTQVIVTKELTTQFAEYSFVEFEGKEIGWIESEYISIIEILGFEADEKFIPYPTTDNISFVNMGRLSPEKAQDNLIKSFAEIVKKNDKCKLYILGSGPLKADLQKLIIELNLSNNVYLVGQLENPFEFMKKCDCFVLSSHYEGQPMVLLEALTLEMNIIATDIVANRTVLEDGKYGLLVEDSVDGLIEGLNKFIIERNTHNGVFYSNKYNEKAMKTFYKALK
ncbi:CDP-glycerol glycerophosphotransferase family protein [Paraliobacillus salinarum]|uniref:CDP-glycerol glycerophosphotransferase family protein n=1 Tax=Paraliobacillus salinarum TaxID=1158996 RepID=UPI001FE44C0A|nr:CDP-glycerol glycerophosphotransferase family protein [Paraliobacillus salinarum]